MPKARRERFCLQPAPPFKAATSAPPWASSPPVCPTDFRLFLHMYIYTSYWLCFSEGPPSHPGNPCSALLTPSDPQRLPSSGQPRSSSLDGPRGPRLQSVNQPIRESTVLPATFRVLFCPGPDTKLTCHAYHLVFSHPPWEAPIWKQRKWKPSEVKHLAQGQAQPVVVGAWT